MNISHNFFILFDNNKAKLVNYKNRKEYFLDKEYIKELIDVSQASDKKSDKDKIINDFISTGILVENNDKPESYIHYYSNIFHNLSKDCSFSMNDSTEEKWAQEYLDICKRVSKKKFPDRNTYQNYNETIQLPKAQDPEISMIDALMNRKTIREFYDKPISIQQFSNVLYYSYGNVHKDEGEYGPFYRRTSPSGGCLQIVETYIAVFNVTGIENGIYWYDSEEHKICLERRDFSFQDLRECLSGQFFANNCAFGVFLASNLEILQWKYTTTRNYKVVFLEAGHFSQTSLLAGVSQNLQTWITGALTESKIEGFCNIDGIKKIPVFFIAYGNGKNDSMHSIMRKKVESYRESLK